MAVIIDILCAYHADAVVALIMPEQIAFSAQHIELAIATTSQHLYATIMIEIAGIDGYHAMLCEVAPFELSIVAQHVDVAVFRANDDFNAPIAIQILDGNCQDAILRVIVPEE